MPPTKPTLPVSDLRAASAPTRNEPVCSSNMIDCTLGCVDDGVDDDEIDVGEFRRDGGQRRGPGEAGHDDGVGTLAGKAAQGLLALGIVLQFEIEIIAAGFGLPGLGAIIGGFVERLVELAAEIIDHGRVGEGGTGQHGAQCDAAGNGLGESGQCHG